MSLFIPEMSGSPSDHNIMRLTPHERIKDMTEMASKVTAFQPGLNKLFTENKKSFLTDIMLQINLIHTRSADLEYAEVTIWDKVLLALSQDGSDIDNPAVITWYARKYWGRNSDGPTSEREGVPEIPNPEPSATSNKAEALQAPSSVASPPTTSSPNIPKSLFDSDPVFEKQWSTYQEAMEDYQSVPEDKAEAKLQAARFLRDTAENGMHYLSRVNHSEAGLALELETTRDMANDIVSSLSGGRKRKFEQPADRPARKIHHSQWEPSRRWSPPTAPRADRESAGRGSGSNSIEVRGGRRGSGGRGGPRGGGGATGRGHSGVPFGYTRPVDSYVPGRR